MLTGRDIICFSNDWRNDPTSKHQIMKLLSRENRIIWVNSIGLRTPTMGAGDAKRIVGKLKSFFRGMEKVNENLYVYTPIIIPFHRIGIVRAINAFILKLALNSYKKKLGMKDVICWSYLPNAGYIIGGLKPKTIVYHCVDEWSKFSFIDDRIVEQERELCGISDVVFASARTLYESRKPYNPNTHYIPHGVDYDYFREKKTADSPVPGDMAGIKHPIAGFFGLIHEWIDLELLADLARDNPDINFVYIGKYSVDIGAVDAFPNTWFLGQKEYSELIDYAKHFDVGLIPFKINDLTIAVNPIKLKEYLALGIPVISVGLPEVKAYERVVHVTENYSQFDSALKDEIAGRHKATFDELDAVARGETWERKVDEISGYITDAESARHGKQSLS